MAESTDTRTTAVGGEVIGGPGSPGTLEVIRQLHARELRVEDLPLETRQACVEHLSLEGFSRADIAELMGISERTVQRDRQAARKTGAVQPDLRLADELLGEFERVTHVSIQRLARMARDERSPVYARLWAEEAISRIYDRFIARADRLGYLEHGGGRLKYQRDMDPERLKRFGRQNDALMEMAVGKPRGNDE